MNSMNELQGKGEHSVLIYGDNQGMIPISHDGIVNERAKHIQVKFYLVRDAVQHGLVRIEYQRTS